MGASFDVYYYFEGRSNIGWRDIMEINEIWGGTVSIGSREPDWEVSS